jgi:hypothetical protein
MMAEIKQKLKIPQVPNFILIETPPGLRQEGWKESPSISIADLPPETLIEIADEWKKELLAKAEIKRESRGNK